MTRFSVTRTIAAAACLLMAASCGKKDAQQQQPPPTEVGVVAAHAESVPLTQNLVGRISAFRTADVRARAAGILQKRSYVEGSDVKEGDVLFEIDPAPLRAALNAQEANLASAKATYTNNHIAAERARSVASKGLLSKADVDAAEAAERTSAAAVKQAQANVDAAKITLGYTRVVAPISGRAGQQQVTEGALVGQSEATLLTTVEQVDPVYVNFSKAVSEIDALRGEAAGGSVHLVEPNKARVEVLRGDGTPSGATGMLDFLDTAVDPATGAVSLRASVPNADHRLLPGQYVTVRVTLGDLARAYLVTQRAVQRDSNGAYVLVVGGDGKVVQKHVTTDTMRDGNWIVTDGLADNDQIIVSNLQKAKPGQPAKATPWQPEADPNAQAKPAQPAQGAQH